MKNVRSIEELSHFIRTSKDTVSTGDYDSYSNLRKIISDAALYSPNHLGDLMHACYVRVIHTNPSRTEDDLYRDALISFANLLLVTDHDLSEIEAREQDGMSDEHYYNYPGEYGAGMNYLAQRAHCDGPELSALIYNPEIPLRQVKKVVNRLIRTDPNSLFNLKRRGTTIDGVTTMAE